jgi:hypothetical protein
MSLSRKQLWRRANTQGMKNRVRHNHEFHLDESNRRFSDSDLKGQINALENRKTRSSSDISKKSVSFSPCAQVIYIPTRTEFRENGLNEHLWWQPIDYNMFKQQVKFDQLPWNFTSSFVSDVS